ncbi:Der1-like family-domain-containing protein [Yarrowia lipolytica]|uniref:Derlin n=1 Tax=Yarrowia lipolytica TaxID=4952 RepID=A0A371BYQ9_YARLL|nr:Der1-like family-domain-containing protein [Yarrowia lipolytica]KAE8173580.1 Der1-like family-domain-containing protein [Yarrowia lipolytica]QNQ01051.1 Derlin-1 [Yarrowia lipolytica]RDW23239.1 Der1-like family-domain-containing protein [Yarrowia lipolytica]RDW36015.1 Der1-like family-domain-containing protein [Yarrowia lipolytica]
MPNVYNEFLKQVPPATKLLTITTVSVFILSRLGFLSPYFPYNQWSTLFQTWELWRPFTALIAIQGSAIPAFYTAYQMYSYSNDLEANHYGGITAKYAWWLTFISLFIWIGDYLLINSPFYTRAFMMALTYAWVQDHKYNQVSFYFVSFSAKFLLPVNLFISLLDDPSDLYPCILGIVAAHTFYFLDTIYPSVYPTYGKFRIVEPPQFYYTLLGTESSAYTSNMGTGSQAPTNPAGASNAWGLGGGPVGGAAADGATTTGASVRSEGSGSFSGRGQRLGT